jgi:hypothetical protein
MKFSCITQRSAGAVRMTCISLLTLAVPAAYGCGGADGAEVTPAASTDEVTAPSAAPGKTPVASLQLSNGHVVEFYDFERGAIISETGAVGTPPSFNRRGPIRGNELRDIWVSLAPGEPVPKALTDLQEKLGKTPQNPQPAPDPRPASGGEVLPEKPAAVPDGTLAVPTGCNNGCCDWDWLSTFWQCQNPFDYNWFQFNYGWSWTESDDVFAFAGMACSAEGTSTYSVLVSGGGGTWSVPQQTYRTSSWVAPWWPIFGFQTERLRSRVNSSSNQHLHTHCGGFDY